MADTYCNYEHLASKEREVRDYEIRMKDRGTSVVIFGPHGGGIEPGTSELVTAVAGEELSHYLFEGKKPKGNGVLHITSTNFDEPKALTILGAYENGI